MFKQIAWRGLASTMRFCPRLEFQNIRSYWSKAISSKDDTDVNAEPRLHQRLLRASGMQYNRHLRNNSLETLLGILRTARSINHQYWRRFPSVQSFRRSAVSKSWKISPNLWQCSEQFSHEMISSSGKSLKLADRDGEKCCEEQVQADFEPQHRVNHFLEQEYCILFQLAKS